MCFFVDRVKKELVESILNVRLLFLVRDATRRVREWVRVRVCGWLSNRVWECVPKRQFAQTAASCSPAGDPFETKDLIYEQSTEEIFAHHEWERWLHLFLFWTNIHQKTFYYLYQFILLILCHFSYFCVILPKYSLGNWILSVLTLRKIFSALLENV